MEPWSLNNAVFLSMFFFGALNITTSLEVLVLLRSRTWQLIGQNDQYSSLVARLAPTRRNPFIGALMLLASGFALPMLVGSPGLFAFAALVSLIGNWLIFSSMKFGQEGADHVRLYVSVFCAIGSCIALVKTPVLGFRVYCVLVTALCVAFYFGAALVKSAERDWWTGVAIQTALSTRLYGQPRIHKFLAMRSFVAAAMSVAVIGWEATFPVVLFYAPSILPAWMAVGVVFHLTVAMVMRLPLFVLAVATMYPPTFWAAFSMGSS